MFLNKYLKTQTLRKVPEITVYFWIIKLLTTAMGESTSDYLVHHFDPAVGVVLGAFGFAIAIILQFLVRRYTAWIYWLAITMVAIFGTMVADVIHIVLGIPYLASAIFFGIILAIIFTIWHATEKTLSIHSINTHRREIFYWVTVITTFALGTAAGDMTAVTLSLGYFASAILFGVLFAVPALSYWKFNLHSVFAFWFAYILTRPLGASLADWLERPTDLGGLGFGTGLISLVLTILILIFVSYLTLTHQDIKEK